MGALDSLKTTTSIPIKGRENRAIKDISKKEMQDRSEWLRYLNGEYLPQIEENNQKDQDDPQISEIILDLHHHTEKQAFTALEETLQKSHEINCAKIKIITGKGANFPEKPGRLFSIVPQWLEHFQDIKKIKSFSLQEGFINVNL